MRLGGGADWSTMTTCGASQVATPSSRPRNLITGPEGRGREVPVSLFTMFSSTFLSPMSTPGLPYKPCNQSLTLQRPTRKNTRSAANNCDWILLGVRSPGLQLGQPGLPVAAYTPGKNEAPGEADRQGESEKGEREGGRRKIGCLPHRSVSLGLGQERKELKRPVRSGLQPCGVSQNPTIASRGETGVQCSRGG